MLARPQQAVIDNRYLLEVMVDAVPVCSLGQIINALFDVRPYRRTTYVEDNQNMISNRKFHALPSLSVT